MGGDWHDAFLLENGNLWVMVGDVVGHGIQAAVVMGRLRSTLRSYALEDIPPEEVLARADRKLQIFEPGETATVMCALLCPPYDEIRVSLAGHPPPVIADGISPAKLIDVAPGLPFGVDLDMPRPAATVPLEPGGVVVAYTDGLVERRTRSLDEGLAILTRAVQPDLPEKVCFDVMDSLIGREPPQDDVAVLVLRRSRG